MKHLSLLLSLSQLFMVKSRTGNTAYLISNDKRAARSVPFYFRFDKQRAASETSCAASLNLRSALPPLG